MRCRSKQGDANLLWFTAVLVILTGFFFVFRLDEEGVDERLVENRRIAATIERNERRVRTREALHAERERLQTQIRGIALHGERNAIVTAFVAQLSRIAAAHHAVVASIAALDSRSASTGKAETGQSDPFDAIPLELTIEGRYVDVLATVRDLSSGHIFAAVTVASLARKNTSGADATISAVVRIELQRLAPGRVSGVGTRPA